MSKPPTYEALPSGGPIWASEPFRIFFPLGILAGIFGMLLWPLHYAGWWPLYPAIQHPRILIFGFGLAFVFGFLGTAWPRFLEAKALSAYEVIPVVGIWLAAQVFYARAEIAQGDFAAGIACLVVLGTLGARLLGKDRDLPPPGFALAFASLAVAALVLFGWSAGWGNHNPEWHHFWRLLAYQGVLLFPILGVGSYLFPRVFQKPGEKPRMKKVPFRGFIVWGSATLILLSFFLEAFASARLGNGVRAGALLFWALFAVRIVFSRAPGTRAWALQGGLLSMVLAFFCRVFWPTQLFAFEHFLFLGGFGLVILLTADRVVISHCTEDTATLGKKSVFWRWLAWLVLLSVATRATADLVPSTRVSHHIYAAVMMALVFLLWLFVHGRNVRRQST